MFQKLCVNRKIDLKTYSCSQIITTPANRA